MRKKENRNWLPLALGVLVFAAIAVWVTLGLRQTAETSSREGLRLAEESIRRAAVNCYAVEGAYPATYDDLKAWSGVQVDEERYAVFYDIFASNIMPDITVVERGDAS